MYINTYLCTYTYIYILKVRERGREQVPFYVLVTHVDGFETHHTHIHTYMNMHIVHMYYKQSERASTFSPGIGTTRGYLNSTTHTHMYVHTYVFMYALVYIYTHICT